MEKEFTAKADRLMDLMINSIYTNKDIFLRELISNASDAMDKLYYLSLTDEKLNINKDDFYIRIEINKDNRTLVIKDKGIGMTEDELINNLGTIAKSGSLDFKKDLEKNDELDIIGQFGVGFYSAFMVSDKIEINTKSYKEDISHLWTSDSKNYTIVDSTKEDIGTEIILYIRNNNDKDDYDKYLNEFNIKNLVKTYSNYIRYPIKMLTEKSRLIEGTEDDPKYETYEEDEILNSMVPIWRKNKNELKKEDYENFFIQKHYGIDKPFLYTHLNIEGAISFKSLLYIPKERPFDFYNVDKKQGLELYSNGVLIMENCEELLPKYFSFVRGVVDSPDISLNISREMLQKTRELTLIKRKIESRIIDELKKILEKDIDKYVEFFKNFGVVIKAGCYDNFGADSDKLKDLLVYESTNNKYTTLAKYVENMKEDQEYIYYQVGNSIEEIRELPQIKSFMDKDYEILLFNDDIDEFVIKTMSKYKDKQFKSLSSSEVSKSEGSKENEDILKAMGEILKDEVVDIRENENLKNDASFLSSEGEISIDMEKTLSKIPGNENLKARKILEINPNHKAFEKLKTLNKDEILFKTYTNLLYNCARLIAGLEIKDKIEFSKNISDLM